MKTKLIGLAAITLALLMSVGMVSANYGYDMNAYIDVTKGFGFQNVSVVEPSDFSKYNTVTIGNYNVSAECVNMSDPSEAITTYEKALALISYDKTIPGTGFASVDVGSDICPIQQSKVITFTQFVRGNDTVVKQRTNITTNGAYYVQDLITAAAPKSYMNFSLEDMSVTIQTCRDVATKIAITKAVEIDAPVDHAQNSLLYHTAIAPNFDPQLELLQYVAAYDLMQGYTITYTKPDC